LSKKKDEPNDSCVLPKLGKCIEPLLIYIIFYFFTLFIVLYLTVFLYLTLCYLFHFKLVLRYEQSDNYVNLWLRRFQLNWNLSYDLWCLRFVICLIHLFLTLYLFYLLVLGLYIDLFWFIIIIMNWLYFISLPLVHYCKWLRLHDFYLL